MIDWRFYAGPGKSCYSGGVICILPSVLTAGCLRCTFEASVTALILGRWSSGTDTELFIRPLLYLGVNYSLLASTCFFESKAIFAYLFLTVVIPFVGGWTATDEVSVMNDGLALGVRFERRIGWFKL